jgi:GDP-L-fucose synthase
VVCDRDVVDFKGELTFDTARPDGTPRKLVDVSRMRRLGWTPKVSLRAGIERTYDAYLRQQMGNGALAPH